MALPIWKWAALVEAWCWAHCKEDGEAELEDVLSRPIQWPWQKSDAVVGRQPASWQTNTTGESLLSVHRKRETTEAG